MPIKVQCSCGASLKAPDKAAGKSLPCPKCKMPISVPDVDPLAAFDQMGGPPASGGAGSVFDGLGVPQSPPPQQQLGVGPPPNQGFGGPQQNPNPFGAPQQQDAPFGTPPQSNPLMGTSPKEPHGERLDKESLDASPYIGGGALIAGLFGAFFMLCNAMTVGDKPEEQDVAAANRGAEQVQKQREMLKPAPVNIPKAQPRRPERNNGAGRPQNNRPNNNRPGRDPNPGNGDNGGNGGSRPAFGESSNDNDRGNDRGNDRPPPEPLDRNLALRGFESAEFLHSGESVQVRARVDLLVNNGKILLPMRPWVVSAGDQRQAMLAALPKAGEQIQLKTEDGQSVSLNHQDLDPTDHAYLARLMVRLGKELASTAAADSSGGGRQKSFADMPLGSPIEVDAMKPAGISKRAIEVAIPSENRNARMTQLVLNSNRSIAMCVASFGSERLPQVRLQMVNLRRQEYMGTYRLNGSRGVPFGITSNDKGIFTYSVPFVSDPAILALWELNGNDIQLVRDVPLDEFLGFAQKEFGRAASAGRGAPVFCGVVNDDTVYVQTSQELLLIDMRAAELIYADPIGSKRPPAISAGRKHMAFQPRRSTGGKNEEILIIDSEELEVAGKFSAPPLDALAFSEDGVKLAGIRDDNLIQVYDVTTSELVDEFPLPTRADYFYWSGSEYLIAVNGGVHTIIDINRACPIGQWSAGRSAEEGLMVSLGAGRFLLGAQQGSQSVVRTAVVPEPEWVPEEVDASQFYVQLEGQSFAIDTSEADFDDADKAEIVSSVTQWVTAGGGKVEDNARLRIVCRTRPGTTESVDYQNSDGRLRRSVNFSTVECEIALYDGDTVLWRETAAFGGPTLAFGEFDDLEKSAAETPWPVAAFFAEAQMPRRFAQGDAWRDLPSH